MTGITIARVSEYADLARRERLGLSGRGFEGGFCSLRGSWVRVPMGTRTHGYAYLRLYPWVRVPTKLNIEMKNLDMSRFLKNRRQYANEIFDLIMQKK